MLTQTYSEGELRLLEAAGLVENSHTFCMRRWIWWSGSGCHTPACVLGHYALAHPETWEIREEEEPRLRSSPSYGEPLSDAAHYFEISINEAIIIFSASGCNNACTGAQAAEFIRKFVFHHARRRILASTE